MSDQGAMGLFRALGVDFVFRKQVSVSSTRTNSLGGSYEGYARSLIMQLNYT
jgi:hypothetical protein